MDWDIICGLRYAINHQDVSSALATGAHVKNKADYIALGAFNNSKTKKIKYTASSNLIKKVKKITKIPVVAIGGINSDNYKKLLLNKANFLAISGYIWNNNKLTPKEAIKVLKWK